MTLLIRRARPPERDAVAGLWDAAATWLQEQGQSQWQYPPRLDGIEASIEARTCWLVEQKPGDPIATVTLDDVADPRRWPPEDQPGTARYVHRLIVGRSHRVPGLGSAILDWAGARAARAGATWLRLDAWTGNARLRQYYLDHGFRLVRVVETPGINSGALFERPATVALGLGPRLAE